MTRYKPKTIEEKIRETLRAFGEDFYEAVEHQTEDDESESLDIATKAIMEIVEEEKRKFELKMITADITTDYTGTARTPQDLDRNIQEFIKNEIKTHEIAIGRLESLLNPKSL